MSLVTGTFFRTSKRPTPELLEWDHAFASNHYPNVVVFLEIKEDDQVTTCFYPNLDMWDTRGVILVQFVNGEREGIRVHLRYCSAEWYTYLNQRQVSLEEFLEAKKYLTV